MCGLVVAVGQVPSLDIFRTMLSTLHHRGPDDAGIVAFGVTGHRACAVDVGCRDELSEIGQPRALLGHRRLTIIDLSEGGHQPMGCPEGRYWIVYNGEIYNYLELREELEKEGEAFISSSDTEVLLRAYLHWGASCLQRLNGMFAFAVYDVKTSRLFVARDRFGIKPLYRWSPPSGGIVLASEIKAFTAHPEWTSRLNKQRGYDFLVHGCLDHTEETLFDGVSRLLPGRFLQVEADGQWAQESWYSLSSEPFVGSMREAARTFRDLLTDSVRLRLRSDVSVGSCLSGGLDSSSIVCLGNRLLQEKGKQSLQKTVSACSEEKEFDEREYMEAVEAYLGVPGHYCYPESDRLLEQLDELVWVQDEPFASTSIWAQWSVFSEARKLGLKVMLDGQGADEQLGGYSGIFNHHLRDLFLQGRWWRLLQEWRRARTLHEGVATFRGALAQLLPGSVRRFGSRFLRSRSTPVLAVDWRMWGLDGRFPWDMAAARGVQRQRLQMMTGSSLPALLRYEDRDSMAHGIEARTPFLDYRLVEFVMGLPSHYLIQNGITKQVLRSGLEGVLPEMVRRRVTKLGFATAEPVWLRQHADWFKRSCREAIDASSSFIDPRLQPHLEAIVDSRRPFNFLVWRVVCFGAWMRRFAVAVDP